MWDLGGGCGRWGVAEDVYSAHRHSKAGRDQQSHVTFFFKFGATAGSMDPWHAAPATEAAPAGRPAGSGMGTMVM